MVREELVGVASSQSMEVVCAPLSLQADKLSLGCNRFCSVSFAHLQVDLESTFCSLQLLLDQSFLLSSSVLLVPADHHLASFFPEEERAVKVQKEKGKISLCRDGKMPAVRSRCQLPDNS